MTDKIIIGEGQNDTVVVQPDIHEHPGKGTLNKQ